MEISLRSKLSLLFCLFIIASFSQANWQAEIQLLQTKIAQEKERIIAENKNIPPVFLVLLDSTIQYGLRTEIEVQNQLKYQKRILNFLTHAEKKENFLNGKYKNGLLFHCNLIDENEKNNLPNYIQTYPLFTISYGSLLKGDTAFSSLLLKQAAISPDYILSHINQYEDYPKIQQVIDEICEQSPAKIKNYLSSQTLVKNFIYNSSNPACITLRNTYEQLSFRSKAYLLLDKLVQHEFSNAEADLATNNPTLLYKNLLAIAEKNNPLGLQSIFQEANFYTTNLIRETNTNVGNSNSGVHYISFNEMTNSELFTTLVLSYQEAKPLVFENIWTLFKRKATLNLNTNLIHHLPKTPLSNFVKNLDQKGRLDEFFSMLTPEQKEYCSNLINFEETIEQMPTLKTFSSTVLSEKKEKETIQPIENKELQHLETEEKKQTTLNPIPVSSKEIVLPKQEEEIPEMISFNIDEEHKNEMRLQKNIYKSMLEIPSFLDEPYAKKILLQAANEAPEEVFRKFEKFQTKIFATEILETASLNAPCILKRYLLNPANTVYLLLEKSTQPAVKKMFDINKETTYKTKPYVLLDEIVSGKVSVPDAIEISENNTSLLKELIKTVSQKSFLGKYNVEKELTFYSLKFIRSINDKIYENENSRFSSIQNLNEDELYFLMVYGREEVFTSTFSGIFARFENKLPETFSDETTARFMAQPKFKTFIALCANYNKLDAFLNHFSNSQKETLLQNFALHLVDENVHFEEAVMVAEAVTNSNNANVQKILQSTIKKEYETHANTNNYAGMACYGILVNLCREKCLEDKNWFEKTGKRYATATISSLNPASLLVNSKIIERMYFYDDEDGKESYRNCINMFQSQAYWRVEDNYNFIKLISKQGNQVEIYLNKPEFEESGNQAINKIFKDNNLEASMVVHRGHSFHTEKTLEKITASTKLVFVGSCGGFYKLYIALRNAPDAHIIATKQIGTQALNDPMILSINEYLRKGEIIQWKKYWEDMKIKLGGNSLFYDYVPPHKNLESLFIKAYYEILGVQ